MQADEIEPSTPPIANRSALPLEIKKGLQNNLQALLNVIADGIEPSTLCLKGRCSTTELRDLANFSKIEILI